MLAIRSTLFAEVVRMACETLRCNKLRSGLTILGVAIGVTSVVGMTALILGFDQSIRDSLDVLGPDTIFVQRFGVVSFANGVEAQQLLKRPNLSISDARALIQQAATLQYVDVELGASAGPTTQRQVSFRDLKTKNLRVLGTSEFYAEGMRVPILAGRFFVGPEVHYRQRVAVLGNTAYKLLFEESGTDPIGKFVRLGSQRFRVVGILDKMPSPGNLNVGSDDIVVVPYTTYQRDFGLRAQTVGRIGTIANIQIAVRSREGVSQAEALADIERVMRIRHGLRLDEPNDFDLVTQDAMLKLYVRISQATFFALVVISSIALVVGGIGVMAIMSISVTERTREIGLRKALGARREEILFQFLTEALLLTSLGGISGAVVGSGIGLCVHLSTGFPIALPWWSFGIGISFSAAVGISFGTYPALRASRLDPIEALRHE